MTFIEKAKEHHHKIYIVFLFIISLGMSFSLIKIHEEFYQAGKDIYIYLAVFGGLLLIVLTHGIDLRKWYVWIEIVACIAAVTAYVLIKHIGPSTYGEIYHKAVILRAVDCATLVFAIVNIWGRETFIYIKRSATSPFFWLSILVCIIIGYIDKGYWPVTLAFVVFFLSGVDEGKWVEIADSFAMSYYAGFAAFFTRSLLLEPNKLDQSGRYIGTFLNNSKLGALCGAAILCAMYFMIRFLKCCERKYIKLVLIVPMFAYGLIAMLMVRGRTGELGLALAVMSALVFLHGSKKKHATLMRVVIVGFCAIVIFIVGVIYGKTLQSRIESGEIESENLSYTVSHIAGAFAKDYTRGEFPANSLLNSIDILSAERLSTWKKLGAQIIPFGHVEGADTATHSTYLYWMVEYGFYPGMAILIWFVLFYIRAAFLSVRGKTYAMLPLLWSAFYAGVFLTSNEYWNAPGGFMLFMFISPLLLRDKKEE